MLRRLFAEAGGETIRAALAAADEVTSSRLASIETRRVVRRAERDGRITAAPAADLLSVFAQAASTWAILEIPEEHLGAALARCEALGAKPTRA